MPRRKRECDEVEDEVKKKARDDDERCAYFIRRRAEHLARSRRRYMMRRSMQQRPMRQTSPSTSKSTTSDFIITYKYEEVAAAPFLQQGTIPLIVETFCRNIFKKKANFYRDLDAIIPSFCRRNEMMPHEGFFAEQRRYIIHWSILLIRTRYAWRRLVHAFLRRRASRAPLDNVDAITLSTIRQSVIVYDMKRRCRYQFDAQSLLHHIVSQLLHHTNGFSNSTTPRNPLTNIPFTYAQLVGIYNQLRAYGRMHWTLAAFAAIQFHIKAFSVMHEPALRLASIRNHVFRDYDGTIEEIVDFIYIWTHFHGLTLISNKLAKIEYALSVNPRNTYLMCWRRLYMRALAANIVHYPESNPSDSPQIAAQRLSILAYSKILTKNIFVFLDEVPCPLQDDDDDDDEEEDYD